LIDFARLTEPVSAEAACGPDLDAVGDPDFLNFMAGAEVLLPAKYFEFNASTIDFPAQFETVDKLLENTRDLRLLTLLSKLLLLNRDLEGFSACIEAMGNLLRDRWDDVHPRVVDGNAQERTAPLNSLEDMPTVMLPLQYAPLAGTERQGMITYRSAMIAAGEVKARQGEQPFDSGSLDKALMEAELDQLVAARGHVVKLRDGLKRIRDVTIERAGYDQAVSFETLPQLVGKIATLLEGVISRRDPGLLGEPSAEETPVEPGSEGAASAVAEATVAQGARVRTVADAAQALAAAGGYFARSEPSSPALLLVRQAQQLIGKSFVDAMRILVPTRVGEAKVQIGSEQAFSLPLEKLSEIAAAAGGSGNGAAAPGGPDASGNGAAAPPIEASTRREAVRLLEEVGNYFRTTEPSSPIPLLTDRARSLVERDFLNLLKDLLPETPPPPAKK
jgi:type VI secretion system protein ImpA